MVIKGSGWIFSQRKYKWVTVSIYCWTQSNSCPYRSVGRRGDVGETVEKIAGSFSRLSRARVKWSRRGRDVIEPRSSPRRREGEIFPSCVGFSVFSVNSFTHDEWLVSKWWWKNTIKLLNSNINCPPRQQICHSNRLVVVGMKFARGATALSAQKQKKCQFPFPPKYVFTWYSLQTTIG